MSYTGRPCLIHTCHAAPVPFPCPAVSKATCVGHGTAWHGRGRATAWHMWINIGPLSTACGRRAYVRLLPANRRSLTNVVWWWCRQQISSSDFSGYHTYFHEGDGRSGAQHDMCELARPRPAWERHGRGMGTACDVWISLKKAALLRYCNRPHSELHVGNWSLPSCCCLYVCVCVLRVSL
jgi:hypothetical protein